MLWPMASLKTLQAYKMPSAKLIVKPAIVTSQPLLMGLEGDIKIDFYQGNG
jgi:hypothetical protein